MKRTWIAVAVALTVVAGGCSGDGGDEPESDAQHSSAPAATAPKEPSVRQLLKKLADDALAIDSKSRVVRLGAGPKAFENTLFHEDTTIAGRGRLLMPATLTIRYPHVDNAALRGFLRLFKKYGLDDGATYDVEDFIHGTVQKSDELRCRFEPGPRFTWLRCIPTEYYLGVEWDVANAITSLYSQETDDKDINLWEVLYPYAYGIEPPVGAILRTGVADRRSQFRAYLYRHDAWELVARADSYLAIARAFGQFVCAPEKPGRFPPVCPGQSI